MARFLVHVARPDTGAELSLAVDADDPAHAAEWATAQGFLVAAVDADDPMPAPTATPAPEHAPGAHAPIPPVLRGPRAISSRGMCSLVTAILITGAVLSAPAILLGAAALVTALSGVVAGGQATPGAIAGAVLLGGPLLLAGWLILIPSLVASAHLRSQAELIRLAS